MTSNDNIERAEVQVVKKFFGKVQIQMTAEGAAYNPLVEVTDWSDEDEDYYRMLILKANRQRLNWFYKQNQNVVTINVRGETNRQMWLTVGGMIGGLLCGFVMKESLSPEIISAFVEDIITPSNTMFMNALKLVIAPVIFFSVISGVTNIGAGAGVGRIGFKIICLYLFTSAICALLTLPLAKILFGDTAAQFQIDSATGAQGTGYEFSLIKFIVDIIPTNLVSPIADGNILQVIFIAVLFGVCMNSLGDRIRPLKEIVGNLNEVFMKMVTLIVLFVPLIAFFAMINLVLNTGLDTLEQVGKLIFGQIIGGGVVLVFYMFMIRFIGKISPVPFIKNIFSLMVVPFSTSSSAVTMPFTMNFCTKKLGIAEKISSFSIPIGTTINMNGTCIYLPLATIMFMKMYGLEVDTNALTIIFAMTISLAVGAPAVPNSGVICILTITSTFGVPAEIAGLLFCIGTICDRIGTCFNVIGDIAATLTLSCTEKLTDEKIYFAS